MVIVDIKLGRYWININSLAPEPYKQCIVTKFYQDVTCYEQWYESMYCYEQ